MTTTVLGNRSPAKAFPAVAVLCQPYCFCACVSFVIMLDVKNVLCDSCVVREVYIWPLLSCALVCQLCSSFFVQKVDQFQRWCNTLSHQKHISFCFVSKAALTHFWPLGAAQQAEDMSL